MLPSGGALSAVIVVIPTPRLNQRREPRGLVIGAAESRSGSPIIYGGPRTLPLSLATSVAKILIRTDVCG
jgi:hypothetical protein